MNPDEIINFDDFLFVEPHAIYEDYNSLLEPRADSLDDHERKISPKPKLLPKPQTPPRKDVITRLLSRESSREPNTSDSVREDDDEHIMSMSIICDSMMDKLKISKNCVEEVIKNTDKELNDFQSGLSSHNSFLQTTAQQLKNAFATIKNVSRVYLNSNLQVLNFWYLFNMITNLLFNFYWSKHFCYFIDFLGMFK